MIAEILDQGGNVLNRVVASREFLDEAYPGAWRAWLDPQALGAAKVAKAAGVDARRDALLGGGFTVPASASPTLAGKVLQTRNADDKLNWLVSQSSYSAAVLSEKGDQLGAQFRSADNATFTLTFAEGLSALLAMAAWGAAIMGRSWALKDAIAAAPDSAALDAIDITARWPS